MFPLAPLVSAAELHFKCPACYDVFLLAADAEIDLLCPGRPLCAKCGAKTMLGQLATLCAAAE